MGKREAELVEARNRAEEDAGAREADLRAKLKVLDLMTRHFANLI